MLEPRSMPVFCISILVFSLPLAAWPDGTFPLPEKLSLKEGEVNAAAFGFAWVVPPDGARAVYAPQLNDGDSSTAIEVPAGHSVQVEWREPREVARVALRGELPPPAEDLEISYWRNHWPDNGSGGWQKLDDPFNGQWVRAQEEAAAIPQGLVGAFKPLSQVEIPSVKRTGLLHRQTYKLRVRFKAAARVSEIEAYTGAVWKTAELAFDWAPRARKRKPWRGNLEARQAMLISKGGGNHGEPLIIKVRYAAAPDRLSADRGYLVFRPEEGQAWSVFVDDVLREGGLFVRGPEVFLSEASQRLRFDRWNGPPDRREHTILEKVKHLPEQTFERATQAIPLKPPAPVHLGVPNLRQEFTITSQGDLVLHRESLRGPGPDLERRPWQEKEIAFSWNRGEKPESEAGLDKPPARRLGRGYLPAIHVKWQKDGLRYHQTVFATVLLGSLGENEEIRRGSEPVALLGKIDLANLLDERKEAALSLSISPERALVWREAEGLLLLETPSDGRPRPGLTPVRLRFDANGHGEAKLEGEKFIYRVRLPARGTHAVFFDIPCLELLDEKEIAALSRLRFDSCYGEARRYWEAKLGEGMQLAVPDEPLAHFYKANLWHVYITTDRDPVTGLYEHGAATMHYPVFPNETCMVARSLEMRGLHQEALRLLEPFLAGQGVKPLPGNFKSKEGVFYAAHPDPEHDPYTAQGYNMHHGFVLWALAEHYLWTRDRAWLERAAPKLIVACDWIIRERAAAKIANPDGTRPLEWGLAPAGDLEDVAEYLHWYATNAYYHLGLKTAAEALAEIGHPEAARLRKEAEEYRKDILQSAAEAVAQSPAVRLRDGTYVPYVPPRAYAHTHLKEGWIREALYCSLHLLDGDLVEPGHPWITWLLEDLEDNIFLSAESGYGIASPEKDFFNYGGFTLQPNLLNNALAHLRRDEIPNFLRVFYNTFAASFYPDTACFAEWVPALGRGGGPLYKTPDEAKFIQSLRQMLILEEGRTLKLGFGVPRAWMAGEKAVEVKGAATFFGPMDLAIHPIGPDGKARAAVRPPRRNPPELVLLRLRHPDGKALRRAEVNGQPWSEVNADGGWIILPGNLEKLEVSAGFE